MNEKRQSRQSLPPEQLVDLGFMDARSKLLDIAAFFDRAERHGGDGDFRVKALKEALAQLVVSHEPSRARQLLELLSDPSHEPAEKSPAKSACGAPLPLE